MAARRSAILDIARTMLTEKGVGQISLRELSDRVGLAKSNVLRYFDSREAVFLELLDEECVSWLEDLEGLLGRPRDRKPNYTNEIRVATTVADSLVARPLLCELLGSMAGGAGAQHLGGVRERLQVPRNGENLGTVRSGGAAPAVAAAGLHRLLRRGRAHPDRRACTRSRYRLIRSARRWPRRAIPTRNSGSSTACGQD